MKNTDAFGKSKLNNRKYIQLYLFVYYITDMQLCVVQNNIEVNSYVTAVFFIGSNMYIYFFSCNYRLNIKIW